MHAYRMRLMISHFLIQILELGSCLVAFDMVMHLTRKGLVASKTGRGQEVGPFQMLALRGQRALRLALKFIFALTVWREYCQPTISKRTFQQP